MCHRNVVGKLIIVQLIVYLSEHVIEPGWCTIEGATEADTHVQGQFGVLSEGTSFRDVLAPELVRQRWPRRP